MGKILLIDDDDIFLTTVKRVLKKMDFEVTTASSGIEALEIVKNETFDVIISDVRMPQLDGIQTLNKIKTENPDSRAIIITGYASDTAPIQAIKLGADDYIKKPFQMDEFINSVRSSLEKYRKARKSSESLDDIQKKYHEFIEKLIVASEKNHPYFHEHASEVSTLSIRIGQKMGLSADQLEKLRFTGLLHDIGMLDIKESVLEKKETLEEKEMNKIKKSPGKAIDMLKEIEGFRNILPLIYHVHEHYDGSGYPEGLTGKEIPLESRIVAVAEAYVSMTSPRPHRSQMSRDEALKAINEEAEKSFDPLIIKDLVDMLREEEVEDEREGKEEEYGKKAKRLNTLCSMAKLYYNVGNLEVASSAVDKVFQELEDTGLTGVTVRANIIRSQVESAQKKMDKAIESASKALKSAKKLGDPLLVAPAFVQMGRVWSESNKFSQAEISFKKAIDIFKKWGTDLEFNQARLNLALLYSRMKRMDDRHEPGYRKELESVLQTVFSLGMDSLIVENGVDFLPLLVSAVEWDIDIENVEEVCKKIIRRNQEAVIEAFLNGEERHQEFLINLLLEIGGKQAKDTLEKMMNFDNTRIQHLASTAYNKLKEESEPLLELHCFGHFTALLGGHEVKDKYWQTRHAKHLFLYLALSEGKLFLEDKLIDMFWGDSPANKGRQSLQTTLTRIRNVFRKKLKDVASPDYIVRDGKFLSFNKEACYWIDVEEFRRCIEAGEKFEGMDNPGKAVVEYQKAERLYEGDLLEGIYEDWCIWKREELWEKYLSCLAKLAHYSLERGNPESAFKYADKILKSDPLNSKGIINYMRASCRMGKRDAAVKRYHQYVRGIEKELGIPPEPDVIRLYNEIIDGKI